MLEIVFRFLVTRYLVLSAFSPRHNHLPALTAMKKPQIDRMVYSVLFPNPVKGRDPPTLQVHITKNLVPEVRQETLCFYGPENCLEAQYPGLDYSNKGHRLRLSRFPWHRRLFRAFDALRLTEREIFLLARWEGTKWARERYEKDEGVSVRDTTWDGIEPAPRGQRATATRRSQDGSDNSGGDTAAEVEDESAYEDEDMLDDEDSDDDAVEEAEPDSEDEVLSNSVGVELNRRLLAATEARARGEDALLDAEWEQWLKEAAERGFTDTSASAGLDMGMVTNMVANTPGTTWGNVIPSVFSYAPGSVVPRHIAYLQSQLPPPPTYPASGLSTNVDSAPSSRPAGTAL